MFKVRSILVMLVLSAVLAGQAMAQDTAASLRGSVLTEDGSPIAGASIVILHVPSGTVARSTASATGSFFQSGLRVGGPYQVTITREGYEPTIVEGLFVDPGVQDPLRFLMVSTGVVSDRILVTGSRFVEAAELNSGVGSVYGSEDIRNQPALDRDVIRTLLRDPLAASRGTGNLSVAGVNPRFNALAIDGSLQQDNFGLGANTYATNRSPINLDAVESVSLVASDYSVTASNFTGGLVNIVTRSGTNEFRGNAYYAHKHDSMIGNKFGDRRFDPGEVREKEYGFTLGGPILRDRLFFFVSYDEYESGAPFDFTNADTVAQRNPAAFDALRPIIQQTYGFDPGPRPASGNNAITSERLLTKFDWNINEDHRASFTYQSTKETGTAISAGSFESAWYDIPLDLTAYSAQLFSDWSNNFSTTFRINYTEFVRGQICRAGPGIGELEIRLAPANVAGTPLQGLIGGNTTLLAGCDRFRHANEYNDDRLQVFLSGDYILGDHVLTFGTEYEEFNLFNLFMQLSRGGFVFNNYQQLVNRTPQQVLYRNVPSNDLNDAAAAWGFDKWTFFLQDQWAVTPDLQLSLGMRYERISQSDRPAFSQPILTEYGVRTDNNLNGKDLWLPRVGFLFTGMDRTTISGGFGLFSGGSPAVWVSNAFQQPFVQAVLTGQQNVSVFDVPQQAINIVAAGTPVPGDFIGPGFNIPSDWKASLRFERAFDLGALGDNYRLTAQYLFTKPKDAFRWEMASQTRLPQTQALGVAPDGRPIYADLNALGIRSLTELTNASGGQSHVYTLGLGKSFESGFDFDVAYVHQNVKFLSEGTSSQGISAWRGIADTDRNNPSPRTSLFQIEHAFKISLGYQRAFFGDYMTRINAFGQIYSGDNWFPSFRFIATQNNHLFGRAGAGENPFDNNPLYVPTPGGDSRVVFAPGFNQSAFFDFVEREGLPTGQIVAPFSRTSRWNNQWDLRFQQELPGIPGLGRWASENRFSAVVDIKNFLNLLNKDWGTLYTGPANGQAAIVTADLISAADLAALGITGAPALTGDQPRTVCTSQSACVYRFNQFNGQDTSFRQARPSVYEIRLTLRYDF